MRGEGGVVVVVVVGVGVERGVGDVFGGIGGLLICEVCVSA